MTRPRNWPCASPALAHIGVGRREQPAAQHGRQLAGVDLFGLALARDAVLDGQGVAEGEGDLLGLAQVGQPVPGEQALAPDDEVLAIRLDRVEELVGVGRQVFFEDGLALPVEDVREHGSGVQIDAAIEFVLLVADHASCPPA